MAWINQRHRLAIGFLSQVRSRSGVHYPTGRDADTQRAEIARKRRQRPGANPGPMFVGTSRMNRSGISWIDDLGHRLARRLTTGSVPVPVLVRS